MRLHVCIVGVGLCGASVCMWCMMCLVSVCLWCVGAGACVYCGCGCTWSVCMCEVCERVWRMGVCVVYGCGCVCVCGKVRHVCETAPI